MELKMALLRDGNAMIYESAENWMILNFFHDVIGSDEEPGRVDLVAANEVIEDDAGDVLIPRHVENGILRQMKAHFGVDQYCIGCGEWFLESTMRRGDGRDWYCPGCANTFLQEEERG